MEENSIKKLPKHKKDTKQENLPMNETEQHWLWLNPYYGEDGDIGKWMLFYPNNYINEAWKNLKKLFDSDELKGVFSVKCSTNKYNNRASSSSDKVIIFFCKNSRDESNIMSIGRNIISKLEYNYCNMIYYKTNAQTIQGTKSTGQKCNYTYKLHIKRGLRFLKPKITR